MRVVFHIISLGAGAGASRVTRYISEREKDPAREGPGSRPLFSEDRDALSYRKADRILDPGEGQPSKDDLLHFSVSFEEKDFDKLGTDEKEKQTRLKDAIREGMLGIAEELNVEGLTWVAGIHRNSEHPHAHVVISKNALERGTRKPKRIGRIPKSLLPCKEIRQGQEVIVNGKIGDRFLEALERQQELYKRSQTKQPELTRAERWELLARKHRELSLEHRSRESPSDRGPTTSIDHSRIASSWNHQHPVQDDELTAFRLALGKRLELEMRLAFTEVWHDRAIKHGETYRFEVVDQSTGQERKISELDVRRRAEARASRASQGDRENRNEVFERDLSRHAETLKQLTEARDAKIAALGKDVSSLRSNLSTVERTIRKRYEMPGEKQGVPLISRQTLSDLQSQAIKLNLPERAAELESLRAQLAREHQTLARTNDEVATLAAQRNVARADSRAKEARLENFEASVHLVSYEVEGERWSLASLDKQIARRREDSKLIPHRAARLDMRSLLYLNYSSDAREQAAADIEHLSNIRADMVRQIEERRAPLVTDRNLAREMVEVLDGAHASEQRSRSQNGLTMPEPNYDQQQINSLEASAELLKDPNLLREVDEWEKVASKTEPEINWEGRAAAREITSRLAVEERRERLQHFLESKKVTSLHLGEHRTGTLRDVEARTIAEYLVRAITESREQRDSRHAVKLVASDQQSRLISGSEKAQEYHQVALELASGARDRKPQFTDKERINLEIYSERSDGTSDRYFGRLRGASIDADRESRVLLTR